MNSLEYITVNQLAEIQDEFREAAKNALGLVHPKRLISNLDRVVIGQDEAKKKLATAVFTHVTKQYMLSLPNHSEKYGNKNNILLMGPSGVGKTLMIRTIAAMTNLPLIEIDATNITPSGYVGRNFDIEFRNIVKDTVEKYGPRKSNFSIVFIDEIDKVCGEDMSRQGWNKSIQASFLKYVEGRDVDGATKFQVSDSPGISSSTMLFVFGGNFEQVRNNRIVKANMGFTGKLDIETQRTEVHDELIRAGVMPELAGRIASVAELQKLTKEQYKQVLTESEVSPYKDYLKMFRFLGEDGTLSEEEIDVAVDEAYNSDTGLRSINSILSKVYSEKIYNLNF
jgi:ATP-dependent Clp protease ATP-binding subunit ClpX